MRSRTSRSLRRLTGSTARMTHLRQWRSAGRASEPSRPSAGWAARAAHEIRRERDEQRRDGHAGGERSHRRQEEARSTQARLGLVAVPQTRVLERFPPPSGAFLTAQALAGIFAMACVTGGCWLVERAITNILWLGVVWTIVICIVDRLIYKSFGTTRRANLTSRCSARRAFADARPRAPACRWCSSILKLSISNQLTQTSAVDKAQRRGRAHLDPSRAGHGPPRCDPGRRDDAENRISKFTRLSGCEKNTNPPARTRTAHRRRVLRKAGEHRARHSGAHTASVDRTQDRRAESPRSATGSELRRPETRTRAHADISHDQYLLARAQALAMIERQHPEVSRYVLLCSALSLRRPRCAR